MSHSEPRMRGRRFLRPAMKKSSRRAREPTNVTSYLITEPADSSQVTSSVLNALNHLGNQRFMLPPFADHYNRWLKDLQSLLNEFEKQMPQVFNANLRKEITESMNDIQSVLAERTKLENIQSSESNKLQQHLARCDAELSQLEHAYKIQTQELRKQYEKTVEKIRSEIDQLDRKRIQILRKNANILRRIFHKSDNLIEETDTVLDSKRSKLRDGEQNLQNDLRKRQQDYAANRQRLISEINGLKQKIHETTASAGNDTLKERHEACQRIHAAITRATQADTATPTTNS